MVRLARVDPRLGPPSGQNCFTSIWARTRVKHFLNTNDKILLTSGPDLGSTRVSKLILYIVRGSW